MLKYGTFCELAYVFSKSCNIRNCNFSLAMLISSEYALMRMSGMEISAVPVVFDAPRSNSSMAFGIINDF